MSITKKKKKNPNTLHILIMKEGKYILRNIFLLIVIVIYF